VIDVIFGVSQALTWTWVIAVTAAQILTTPIAPGRPTGKLRDLADTLVQIHLALWPIAGPGLLLHLTNATMHGYTVSVVGDMLLLICWWLDRNWPDDHFKRRRKKIKDAVKVVGGRLVVKPAPA